MRTFELHPKKRADFNRGEYFYYETDLTESIKSCTPGEWIHVKIQNKLTLGFVNPFAQKSKVTILHGNADSVEEYIDQKIYSAVNKRQLFGYKGGSRLIHGFADGLPGVVADEYRNIIILQINSAGFDLYRGLIRDKLVDLVSKDVIFLDNETYRKNEGLPIYDTPELPSEIEIDDMDIKYEMPSDVLQKVGYYYDHRENRLKFEKLLTRFDKKFAKGVDLFCYIGSWGLHGLKAGVVEFTFVDQANMESVVMKNCEINNFSQKGSFVRSDVFKFLTDAVEKQEKYDVIVCDPPAFNKSAKNKKQSLVGYKKLYSSIMKIISEKGIVVAASCTQNITIEELDSVVGQAAGEKGKRVQLLDLGIQGMDHPIDSLKSKSNYIKYLCYIVE
jgi:23S rRNA (cytosine1962-C5)-methyltransferase